MICVTLGVLFPKFVLYDLVVKGKNKGDFMIPV